MPVYKCHLSYQPPRAVPSETHPGSPFLVIAKDRSQAADRCIEDHFDERLRTVGFHPIVRVEDLADPFLERALVVNTAHAPSGDSVDETWNGRGLPRLIRGLDEWILVLADTEELATKMWPDLPAWAAPLVEYALAHSVTYLVFECDGPVLDDFPTYNW